MQRQRRRAVGALVLLTAILLGACGGDDDGGSKDQAEGFCGARIELEDRITELQGFDLADEEGVPEARQRVLALVDALRTMLDAAPEEIRIEADTMGSGLDELEARVEDADLIELGTEVPRLLAEIGGAGGSEEQADAVTAVNNYAADACG